MTSKILSYHQHKCVDFDICLISYLRTNEVISLLDMIDISLDFEIV